MSELSSIIRGFTFNNKHNHGEGVVMHSKNISPPSKKKIKESVPFMNGSYDFSTVGSNGEITYTEREIKVVLGLPTSSKEQLQILYSKTLEWLVDVGQSQLIFDDADDYYWMAEVEGANTFDQVMSFGMLTVTFIAEPFKRSVNYIGDDIWDTFNFEEDYSQAASYSVVGTRTITMYNTGRATMPIINCSSPMSLIMNGFTYNLVAGDNKLYAFKLQNGSNIMVVNGTGIVKFIFRKVSL